MNQDTDLCFRDAKGRTWELPQLEREELQQLYAEECGDARKAMRTNFSKITMGEAFGKVQDGMMNLLLRLVSDQLNQRGVTKEDFVESLPDVKYKAAATEALLKLMEKT